MASPKSEMDRFRVAARKVDKLIDVVADGGSSDDHRAVQDEILAVYRAIDRLYDRANKAEIRGEPALAIDAQGMIDALRVRMTVAKEAGAEARRKRRGEEIARLRSIDRYADLGHRAGAFPRAGKRAFARARAAARRLRIRSDRPLARGRQT